MTAKVKNLMNELVKRETLEQGGDDAYNALDDKNTWFARRYIRDKERIIDRIQNMLIIGIVTTSLSSLKQRKKLFGCSEDWTTGVTNMVSV